MRQYLESLRNMDIRQVISSVLDNYEKETLEQEAEIRDLMSDVFYLKLKSNDPEFSSENPRYNEAFSVITKEFNDHISRFMHIKMGVPYLRYLLEHQPDGSEILDEIKADMVSRMTELQRLSEKDAEERFAREQEIKDA